jgi:hypothetical protein
MMHNSLKYLMLLVCCIYCSFSHAQNILVLKKHAKTIGINYTGHRLVLKTSQDKDWVIYRLDSIGDDYLILNGDVILIENITRIKVERVSFNYFANGMMLAIAGALVPAISFVNGASMEDLRQNNSTLYASGGLIGAGLLSMSRRNKNISLGKRSSYYLRTFINYN